MSCLTNQCKHTRLRAFVRTLGSSTLNVNIVAVMHKQVCFFARKLMWFAITI